MRTWEPARSGGETCGRCGMPIAEDAPVLALYPDAAGPTAAPRRWRKVRCEGCAGRTFGETPDAAQIEAARAAQASRPAPTAMRTHRPVRVSPPRRPVPLREIADDLPFDARMAAAGERAGDDDA